MQKSTCSTLCHVSTQWEFFNKIKKCEFGPIPALKHQNNTIQDESEARQYQPIHMKTSKDVIGLSYHFSYSATMTSFSRRRRHEVLSRSSLTEDSLRTQAVYLQLGLFRWDFCKTSIWIWPLRHCAKFFLYLRYPRDGDVLQRQTRNILSLMHVL